MMGLLTVGIVVIPNMVNAKEINLDINNKCDVPLLESIGTINRNNSITVNGVTTSTFCTFENQENALKNIKVESSELLNKIMEKYSFEAITDDNWKQYYDVLENYIGTLENEEYTETIYNQHMQLRAFFDIYGDVERNEEIEEYVNNSLRTRSNIISDEEFINLLPYHSELAISYYESKPQTYANRGTYNATKAIEYAKNNAYNTNSSEYGYITSDCTNFTSQVYNKGGLSQESTGNVNTGWWHTKNGSSHLHSKNWAYANNFANYWGVSLRTREVNQFASNIKPGGAIAGDWTNNGVWNHTGIVTATSTNLVSFSNAGAGIAIPYTYYDFQVAQHNHEYLAWASSNTNNWETTGANGGAFGIIKH